MTTKNKLSNLSNEELLELLDKYNKEIEDVFQEIIKRQDQGKMKKFMSVDEFTELCKKKKAS